MVSDSDLVTRLREILSKSDLDTATAGGIRRQLEEDFGVDLSDRKKFIREQIDIFLEALENVKQTEERVEEDQNQNDGVKEEEEEEEEEEERNSQNDGVEEQEEEEMESERSSKAEKVRKRGGFTKLCSLSPQLQEVVGSPELARTEVVKKLWAYIRENNLQDPKNKKKIKCDEALRAVFRVNSIDMFQMNKALSRHIWPLAAKDERAKQNKCEDNSESVADNEEEVEEEQEEDEEQEEEEAVERESNGRTKKRGSTEVDKDVKRKAGGFTKLCTLSPQLQDFTGVAELARTGVVKKIWAHIRKNNLQDPKNKRNIICDESLHALFHVDSIDMFQMNKALSKHILGAANEEDAPSNSSQKEKVRSKQVREQAPSSSYKKEKRDKRGREEDPDESKQCEKRQKKSSSGLLVPLRLSDALIKFFGTGENALSRSDVVKRMWEYVKENDLQDPSDKRIIICDEKLKELFKVDSFTGFTVSKLLSSHFIKAEKEQ